MWEGVWLRQHSISTESTLLILACQWQTSKESHEIAYMIRWQPMHTKKVFGTHYLHPA